MISVLIMLYVLLGFTFISGFYFNSKAPFIKFALATVIWPFFMLFLLGEHMAYDWRHRK